MLFIILYHFNKATMQETMLQRDVANLDLSKVNNLKYLIKFLLSLCFTWNIWSIFYYLHKLCYLLVSFVAGSRTSAKTNFSFCKSFCYHYSAVPKQLCEKLWTKTNALWKEIRESRSCYGLVRSKSKSTYLLQIFLILETILLIFKNLPILL